MKNIKNIFDKALSSVVIVIMALMVLNVLWQIFTRFVLKDSSSYTEELARYLLIWLGLLGASYVSGKKLHLAIDWLSIKLPETKKKYVGIFIELCILFFAIVVMVIGGINLSILTFQLNQISAALQIPLGYVYLAIPISGFFISFYSIDSIIDYSKQLQNLTSKRA